jgi:hypothetical protein
VILASKQAAFIKNPEYLGEGSGPEFITIGHNPFAPNLGLVHHIVLNERGHSNIEDSLRGINSERQHYTRKKFIDEYLFDRLFLASKPFTTSILRSLRSKIDINTNKSGLPANLPYGCHHIDPAILVNSNRIESTLFADFVSTFKEFFQTKSIKSNGSISSTAKSYDPAIKLAFSSKLDIQTKQIQDLQVIS